MSIADIPAKGTGLGSSSSYTVGLLHALHAYNGEFASADRLAREACEIEIDRCGEPVGKQDQYAAAYGGSVLAIDPVQYPRVAQLNFIEGSPDNAITAVAVLDQKIPIK